MSQPPINHDATKPKASAHPKTKPTIYVLLGHDNEDDYREYKQRTDCVIIRFDDPRYQKFSDAVAAIKPPAHVVLQTHGTPHGYFRWRTDGPYFSYQTAFGIMPEQGILSITLGSCYGGQSNATKNAKAFILTAAPAGTLVFAMTGPSTELPAIVTDQFAEETKGLHNPIDFFLEVLDNYDPKYFKDWQERNNKRDPIDADEARPDYALPHIIGIGGQPPQQLDLANEYKTLKGKLNDPALMRTIQRVQTRFDTRAGHISFKNGIEKFNMVHSFGPTAERALEKRIADLAHKLASQEGYSLPTAAKGKELTPEQVDEKRLVYAITAAYLDESGELNRRIEQAKQQTENQTHYDAFGGKVDLASLHFARSLIAKQDHTKYVPANSGILASWRQQHPNMITESEHLYLETVQTKLANDPAVITIMDQLTRAFSVSQGNDSIKKGGELDKELHARGVSTKSWVR